MTQPVPRRARSNVARFWIGVALCLPVLFVVGVLESIPTAVANAVDLPSELSAIATLGLNVALFAAMILGLVKERSRFVVVGILAGLAILFVLAAGACIVLLVGLSNSGP